MLTVQIAKDGPHGVALALVIADTLQALGLPVEVPSTAEAVRGAMRTELLRELAYSLRAGGECIVVQVS